MFSRTRRAAEASRPSGVTRAVQMLDTSDPGEGWLETSQTTTYALPSQTTCGFSPTPRIRPLPSRIRPAADMRVPMIERSWGIRESSRTAK